MNKFPYKFELSLKFLVAGLLVAFGSGSAFAQGSGRNNPYSPSPSGKPKQSEQAIATTPPRSGPAEVTFVMQRANEPFVDDSRLDPTRPNIAQQTYKIAKTAEIRSRPVTETYKIGIGDVLFVNLKNSPQGSGYYSVRDDGTIDYPLAGDHVVVADQTTDILEDTLASSIKLFPDPQIEVKVRQFSSHKVTVKGLVDNPGEKNLQREAMPLYVLRAEANVDAKATKVQITRGPALKLETYELHDPATENVLIYPGNTLEFTGPAGGFYFIAGEVVSSGQKDLATGMTLYQAVIAAGGAKGDPKKAFVRRKNDKGMFATTEYSLRSIKDGKATDPGLVSGDVIEIR